MCIFVPLILLELSGSVSAGVVEWRSFIMHASCPIIGPSIFNGPYMVSNFIGSSSLSKLL